MSKNNPFAKHSEDNETNPFSRLTKSDLDKVKKGSFHTMRGGYRCSTDDLGHKTPQNRGPAELVLNASEGFIPLWEQEVTLRWRFNENSFLQFTNPPAAKKAVQNLMSKGLLLWQDAVPIKFIEQSDAWDFEVLVREQDDCDINGCTLASAFFPDQGRHQLHIFPKAFEQSAKEQVETMAHEFGHVFGLRHFFAKLHETDWASEIFGKHRPFSIMNYGDKSRMTKQDRADLKLLYSQVWSGKLKHINGTRIKLVRPYHVA